MYREWSSFTRVETQSTDFTRTIRWIGGSVPLTLADLNHNLGNSKAQGLNVKRMSRWCPFAVELLFQIPQPSVSPLCLFLVHDVSLELCEGEVTSFLWSCLLSIHDAMPLKSVLGLLFFQSTHYMALIPPTSDRPMWLWCFITAKTETRLILLQIQH